jgi:hypothetical protein
MWTIRHAVGLDQRLEVLPRFVVPRAEVFAMGDDRVWQIVCEAFHNLR